MARLLDLHVPEPGSTPTVHSEVASIRGMLSAFAEGRARWQAQQAQLAQQRQFHADNQANIAADNARADKQIGLTESHYKATEEHQRTQAERQAEQQKRTAAAGAFPQIQKYLDPRSPDYNPAAAQALGGLSHLNVEPEQAPHPEPMPAMGPGTVQSRAGLEPPPVVPGGGDVPVRGLPMGLPATGPKGPPVHVSSRYVITLPNGQKVAQDPGAGLAHRDRLADESSSRLAAVAQTPLGKRALAEATAMARSGDDRPLPKIFQDTLRHFEDQEATTKRAYISAAAARNRHETPSKATTEDVKEQSRIENDIAGIDESIAIIKNNPSAWNEYRGNTESWKRQEEASKGALYNTGRRLLQGIGVADVAPEQGLGTTDAKRLHSNTTRVTNSIAKGYGGAIVEGDRDAAASEITALANDPNEQIEVLMRVRSRLARGLGNLRKNKQIQSAGAEAPAPSDVTPEDDARMRRAGF